MKAMLTRRLALLVFALHLAAWGFAQPPAPRAAPPRSLTIEDVFGPGPTVDMYGDLPEIFAWMPDGKAYIEYADNGAGVVQLMRIDALTGNRAPLYDQPRMAAALAALPGLAAGAAQRLSHLPLAGDGRGGATLNAARDALLFAAGGRLVVYRFASGRATWLTPAGKPGSPAPRNESFSPDGKTVAFVRGNNLYTVALDKPLVERPLTSDGSETRLNGRLDWVYEEELYGRGNTGGYAWSGDSQRIAFLQLDETDVRKFPIVDHLKRFGEGESTWYPLPGEANPVVRLGVVGADGKAPPRWADLSRWPDKDRLIVRFAWTPDSKTVVFQAQDRTQTTLDVVAENALTGKTRTLFRETSRAWVDVLDNPVFLRDGSFLWQSNRTGYRHLYRYGANGALAGTITSGEWDIREVYGVDERNKQIYFRADKDNPIAPQVYRVALSGGTPARLTPADGTHEARFDPTFTYFTDGWSRFSVALQVRLARAASGETVRTISDNPEPNKTLARFKTGTPEFMTVTTRDGAPLHAILIRPPDFDPTRRYPVFCPVYGGPGLPTVKDEWAGRDYLFYQLLASRGYLVWLCDNRSAGGPGVRSQWPIYRKMGVSELQDVEDGLAYLKAQPWVDGGRIGIFGWSYGGFMAEYALTHSKSFKVGISCAGVSDWQLYDSIYTERYMNTPQANPDGYADVPARTARNTRGKLLIVHGMMDDNVHVQNSVEMIDGLEHADKRFEMMFYPGPFARHGFADPALDRHVQILITRFILENL